MPTVMASLYPAMKGRRVYIKHRRTPQDFNTIRVVHQYLTVPIHLHFHLPNLIFPNTLSPILKWHPNKSKKGTDGTSSQRKNSNTLHHTSKTFQKRRRRLSLSSAAHGPSGCMALSFGTSPYDLHPTHLSCIIQLISTTPQGRCRPFHSPHLRKRLHTPSHHPAPLRRPRPPPQIPHDRRSSVLHEPLHLQWYNPRCEARRLCQEFLDGTESQIRLFSKPRIRVRNCWVRV